MFDYFYLLLDIDYILHIIHINKALYVHQISKFAQIELQFLIF